MRPPPRLPEIPTAVLLMVATAVAPCIAAGTASDITELDKLVVAGKFLEARQLSQQLLQRSPRRADVHLSYGRLLRSTGQNEKAIEQFRKTTELDPKLAEPLVALAEIYLQNLDIDKALLYSQRALKVNSQSIPAHRVFLSALMESNRLSEAERELRTLLLSNGHEPDTLHLAYLVETRKGDFVLARKYLQAAVSERPDNIEWKVQLSQLLENSGEYKAARKYLVDLLARHPEAIDARLHLARNLEYFGNDYDAAIQQYQQVLLVDSDAPQALTGVERCRAKKNNLALRLKLGLQAMTQSFSRK